MAPWLSENRWGVDVDAGLFGRWGPSDRPDLVLVDGVPERDGVDLGRTRGVGVLEQAVLMRLITMRGELRRHPTYGSLLHTLVGQPNLPRVRARAAVYVREALRAEGRLSSIDRVDVRPSGADPTVIDIAVRARSAATGAAVEAEVSFALESV